MAYQGWGRRPLFINIWQKRAKKTNIFSVPNRFTDWVASWGGGAAPFLNIILQQKNKKSIEQKFYFWYYFYFYAIELKLYKINSFLKRYVRYYDWPLISGDKMSLSP
jgi:hypothetical protein